MTVKFKLSVLTVWSGTKRISSSSRESIPFSRHDIAEKLLTWCETKITTLILRFFGS